MANPPNSSAADSEGDPIGGLQPNSSHCFVCGLENPHGLKLRFRNLGPGEVEARTRVPKDYEGYPGIVHGGIVASMLDEIVGRLAMTDDPNRFLVTARLELRYREPIPVEQEIMLRGHLVGQRGRRYEGRAELLLETGAVGAECEAILVEHPDSPTDGGLLRSLGWGVYPESK